MKKREGKLLSLYYNLKKPEKQAQNYIFYRYYGSTDKVSTLLREIKNRSVFISIWICINIDQGICVNEDA